MVGITHLFVGFAGTWISSAVALNNGLALTPPMGLNTWNSFRCDNVSAINIKAFADAMISKGLKYAGYRYINIDDCWATGRDPATQELIPDPNAFPLGMKDLSNYVHSKGLLLGIYGDRGRSTCAGRPGSLGFEEVDAKTYAEWRIDYLKQDSCYADFDHKSAFRDYSKMQSALNATGRSILFSLCGWNSWYAPAGKDIGNSWRIAADSDDWPHIYAAARTNEVLGQYAGPGGWNDPDMLVGSVQSNAIHLTERQQRTQFSLWSVMSAPLLIGSNLETLSKHDLDTLTNMDVIAVNQDVTGSFQGTPVFSNCPEFIPKEQNPHKPWNRTVAEAHTLGLDSVTITVVGCVWFVGFLACSSAVRGEKKNRQLEESLIQSGTGHCGFSFLLGSSCTILGFILMVTAATWTTSQWMGMPTPDDCKNICITAVTCLWFVGFFACTLVIRYKQNNREASTQNETRYGQHLFLLGSSCAILGFILMVAAIAWTIYWYTGIPTVDDCQQTWSKRLSSNGGTDVAVLLVNWGPSAKQIDWCNVSCLAKLGFPAGACAQDLWLHYEPHNGKPSRWLQSLSDLVPANGGSIMYKLSSSNTSCMTLPTRS